LYRGHALADDVAVFWFDLYRYHIATFLDGCYQSRTHSSKRVEDYATNRGNETHGPTH